MISGREGLGEIYLNRDLNVASGTNTKPQPGVALTAPGKDEHDGPIRTAEAPRKCLFIYATWLGRIGRMCVQP